MNHNSANPTWCQYEVTSGAIQNDEGKEKWICKLITESSISLIRHLYIAIDRTMVMIICETRRYAANVLEMPDWGTSLISINPCTSNNSYEAGWKSIKSYQRSISAVLDTTFPFYTKLLKIFYTVSICLSTQAMRMILKVVA